MIKLQSEKYIAVWLDHQNLVSLKYPKTGTRYELRLEIFNFKRKPPVQNKRKRKKITSDLSEMPIEYDEVEKAAKEFLKICSEKGFFNKDFKGIDIERTWEEEYSFSKFNGGNESDCFHKLFLNNKEYLIPPHCRFFNYDVTQIDQLINEGKLGKFDFILMDPPWKNKYIRRIKKVKTDLGYSMMDNESLQKIPIEHLTTSKSVVAIWCTNSRQHQNDILENFLPAWKMKYIAKLYWVKLNTDGTTICSFNEPSKKQPFEVIFVAIQEASTIDISTIQNIKIVLSIPSIIHSHKPPILKIFEDMLPKQPKCLEIFSRYLQPNFTSIGLETLKLMDTRLYIEETT